MATQMLPQAFVPAGHAGLQPALSPPAPAPPPALAVEVEVELLPPAPPGSPLPVVVALAPPWPMPPPPPWTPPDEVDPALDAAVDAEPPPPLPLELLHPKAIKEVAKT